MRYVWDKEGKEWVKRSTILAKNKAKKARERTEAEGDCMVGGERFNLLVDDIEFIEEVKQVADDVVGTVGDMVVGGVEDKMNDGQKNVEIYFPVQVFNHRWQYDGSCEDCVVTVCNLVVQMSSRKKCICTVQNVITSTEKSLLFWSLSMQSWTLL